MLTLARKLLQRGRSLLPVQGFFFDRPIVLLQSDDWGRSGLRDHEGLDQLRSAGLILGERPYDLYTLETADDLSALSRFLKRHRDATGRPACIGMNFLTANLDFARMAVEDFSQIHLRPITEGLSDHWQRPGLFEAYREGIDAGVFYPALHGYTHFCRRAVERELAIGRERATLLRTLWKAGIPYIHWRMPWVGYEYWDPEQPADERFLSADAQADLIGLAVGIFAKFFATLPRSACAPGYRANRDTQRAWAQHGVRVAQNGSGTLTPPHLDDFGILHLHRSMDFEPALGEALAVDECMRTAGECFAKGIPVIVSLHSINFHSSVEDFRSHTLTLLDEFLSALETKYPDLLYLHDGDLCDLVQTGAYAAESGSARIEVSRRRFTRSSVIQR
jgi:hypothetical protein